MKYREEDERKIRCLTYVIRTGNEFFEAPACKRKSYKAEVGTVVVWLLSLYKPIIGIFIYPCVGTFFSLSLD